MKSSGRIKLANLPLRFGIVIICGLMLVGLMAADTGVLSDKSPKKLKDTSNWPTTFGFGRTANKEEIAKWDISIRPDGKGLPAGEGNAIKGAAIYKLKCAACHGIEGRELPGTKLPAPALVSDTIAKSRPKTIGNYWPYATTVFDYIRRAMPFNSPGSLTDNEVYSLTAYLLTANQVIKPNTVLNGQNLAKVIMPAKKIFIVDDRKGGLEVK